MPPVTLAVLVDSESRVAAGAGESNTSGLSRGIQLGRLPGPGAIIEPWPDSRDWHGRVPVNPDKETVAHRDWQHHPSPTVLRY